MGCFDVDQARDHVVCVRPGHSHVAVFGGDVRAWHAEQVFDVQCLHGET